MVAPIIDRFAAGVANAISVTPYLTAFPPSLDPSDWPDTRRFRVVEPSTDTSPQRLTAHQDGPLVYVTFGSVLGHLREAAGAYRCALDAVAGLPARVLMTVGHATDVTSLGAIPANTRVQHWVAQEAVLVHAAVVVCHGSSGTMLGALAASVPLVICPLFADQPHNARAVRDAGAGVIVAAEDDAPGGVRALGLEPFRRGAARSDQG